MPCRLEPWEVAFEEAKLKEQNDKRNSDFAKKNDVLTEIACQACRELEKQNLIQKQSTLLKLWWEKHKEEDKKRLKEQEDIENKKREKRRNIYEKLRKEFEISDGC
jgi:hypothetical protein